MVKAAIKQQVSPWSPEEREAWKLPEKVTVSQWADRDRVLSPKVSSEPGQWRTARAPYLRGIMDSFTDGDVEEVVIVKPPQSGGTEALYNMLGYVICQDPGPALLVNPRDTDSEYVAENRLKPMIEDSPEILRHTTKSPRDLTLSEFRFDRMTLYFAASNSPAGLGSKPIRYLFLDEVDKYPPFAGKEANPIDLARKRTLTFWDRMIVIVSTPTTTTGPVWVTYQKSNMQQYYVPCHHCKEYAVLKSANLKIKPGLRDPDEIKNLDGCVWYECEHCKGRIEEHKKADMVKAGVWVPEGCSVDSTGKVTGKPSRSKKRSGFQYSALISTWVSWPEIMAEWFDANTESGVALGKLMDFYNAILAEPYVERAKQVKVSDLKKRRGGFSCGTVPSDCLILVAGADYHKSKNRGIVSIAYEVRGFGYGMKNWVIKSGWVTSFDQLDQAVLMEPFAWSDATGREQSPPSVGIAYGPKGPWLPVTCLFVDSGYEPDDVYEYCRTRPGLAWPTKGAPTAKLKPLTASPLESATEQRLTPKQRKRYRGMQLITIDTHYFKDQVTSWVEPRTDIEGNVTMQPLTEYYAEIPSSYFQEFSNEHKIRVIDKRGNSKFVWEPLTKNAQVHFMDTAVGTAAAAWFKGVPYLREPTAKKQVPAAVRSGQVTRPVQKKRPSGWLDNLPRM